MSYQEPIITRQNNNIVKTPGIARFQPTITSTRARTIKKKTKNGTIFKRDKYPVE